MTKVVTMRIVKIENPIYTHVKTLPANVISRILLDLRILCSGYNELGITAQSNIAYEIYDLLERDEKTYLFNVTNFDQNLLSQCTDNIRRNSTKPAYLVYNHLERLEVEQSMYLKKFLPIYPENDNLFLRQCLQSIIENIMENKNKRGDNNANFRWE